MVFSSKAKPLSCLVFQLTSLCSTDRNNSKILKKTADINACRSCDAEWRVEDGTWAKVDQDSKLVELAPDLKGDGSSENRGFEVRGETTCEPAGSHSPQDHANPGDS